MKSTCISVDLLLLNATFTTGHGIDCDGRSDRGTSGKIVVPIKSNVLELTDE